MNAILSGFARSLRRLAGDCSRFCVTRLGEPDIARLGGGLLFLTWVSALSMPFAVWPYLLFLPLILFPGISKLACAWSLIIVWVWLGIPSVSGRGFALLKAVLPVIIGSSSGRFIRRRAKRLLAIIFATVIPFCILAIVQWVYRAPTPSVWLSEAERWILPTRITAVYGNPNLFAGVLLFLLPIGIAWIPAEGDRWVRVLGWGWAMIVFSCLMLTFSYGAWTAAIFSLAVLAATRLARDRWAILLAVPLCAVVILGMIGAWHGSTADYRWMLWRETWHIFLKHPWGVGPDELQAFLAVSQTPSDHAHNLFLQTLAETGLFGVGILLLLVGKVARQIRRVVDQNCAGVVAALCGLILYGMVDYIWTTPLLTGLFWLGEGMLEEPS
jgi:O-antigen ligase